MAPMCVRRAQVPLCLLESRVPTSIKRSSKEATLYTAHSSLPARLDSCLCCLDDIKHRREICVSSQHPRQQTRQSSSRSKIRALSPSCPCKTHAAPVLSEGRMILVGSDGNARAGGPLLLTPTSPNPQAYINVFGNIHRDFVPRCPTTPPSRGSWCAMPLGVIAPASSRWLRLP